VSQALERGIRSRVGRARAIDAAIGSQSWQIAILLRLNALVPFNFQSYFFGQRTSGLCPMP
jgi:uncharacterized membrane protein YdjX (TVP38/TMEM64 family)